MSALQTLTLHKTIALYAMPLISGMQVYRNVKLVLPVSSIIPQLEIAFVLLQPLISIQRHYASLVMPLTFGIIAHLLANHAQAVSHLIQIVGNAFAHLVLHTTILIIDYVWLASSLITGILLLVPVKVALTIIIGTKVLESAFVALQGILLMLQLIVANVGMLLRTNFLMGNV